MQSKLSYKPLQEILNKSTRPARIVLFTNLGIVVIGIASLAASKHFFNLITERDANCYNSGINDILPQVQNCRIENTIFDQFHPDSLKDFFKDRVCGHGLADKINIFCFFHVFCYNASCTTQTMKNIYDSIYTLSHTVDADAQDLETGNNLFIVGNVLTSVSSFFSVIAASCLIKQHFTNKKHLISPEESLQNHAIKEYLKLIYKHCKSFIGQAKGMNYDVKSVLEMQIINAVFSGFTENKIQQSITINHNLIIEPKFVELDEETSKVYSFKVPFLHRGEKQTLVFDMSIAKLSKILPQIIVDAKKETNFDEPHLGIDIDENSSLLLKNGVSKPKIKQQSRCLVM